jgi:hypothetical protein
MQEVKRGRPRNAEKMKKSSIARIFWANIRKQQYLLGIEDESLAGMLGVTGRTLLNWDKEPENIRLGTVNTFCISTGIEIAELIK